MNKARSRYYRSIVISMLALAALLWLAVDQFGIPGEEIRQLLLASVLVVALVVAAAAAATLLWVLLRKLVRRNRR